MEMASEYPFRGSFETAANDGYRMFGQQRGLLAPLTQAQNEYENYLFLCHIFHRTHNAWQPSFTHDFRVLVYLHFNIDNNMRKVNVNMKEKSGVE